MKCSTSSLLRLPPTASASAGGFFAALCRERGGSLGISFGFGAFLLMLALYGGLMFYNRNQEGAVEKVVEEIAAKKQEIDPETMKKILLLDSQLKDIRTLLKNHVVSSRIFSLLENNTLPQVSYSSFSFDAKKGTVDMGGLTPSYALLAHQIAQFERASDAVSAVSFGNPDKTEKGIKFTLTLTLKPAIYSFVQ